MGFWMRYRAYFPGVGQGFAVNGPFAPAAGGIRGRRPVPPAAPPALKGKEAVPPAARAKSLLKGVELGGAFFIYPPKVVEFMGLP